MKLATFSARIDGGGQVAEELGVEGATGEGGVEMTGIDAGEVGLEAGGDHLCGKLGGGDAPDGKDGFEASACKALDAVGADVFEE